MRTDFLHRTADAAAMAEETIRPQGAMAIKVAATDASYLDGTYSKAFVSEMAIQLTAEIERCLLVSGLGKSDIALEMVFAPGTYFEHPQDGYTYRRLLISESGRAVKDLWVKWHRVGEGANFTVCDAISRDDIRFSLGEDVPQKVREKEYRFLVRADAEQYRAAMGRKNVTEWREIIKRALKRGALKQLTIDDKVAEHAGLIKDKLEEILGKISLASEAPAVSSEPEKDEAYEKAMAYMRSFVEENKPKAVPEAEAETAAEAAPEIVEIEAAPVEEAAREEEEPEQIEMFVAEPAPAEPKEPAVDLDAMRAEMEAKLRAEMESREKALLEKEQELERQKQALAAELKEQEAARIERENELRRQAQNQARLEWEAKERDRLAAQAQEAIERRKAEEARLAEEARKAEEARIAEEARKAEEARLAEEARKAEEARIAEEARKAEEAQKAVEVKAEEPYTYTEKLVHLIFRHPVDPNVLGRIQELMTDTIRYFKKESVFIKVKATIPSENTVDLHFTKFPEEEHQLLVDMIQVLGNSNLGICRVRVE